VRRALIGFESRERLTRELGIALRNFADQFEKQR
jgi:hypothetical protein